MAITNEDPSPGRDRTVKPRDSPSPLRRAHESGDRLLGGVFLLERCGTIDDLEALVDEELPVEPFAWDSVAQQDRARVAGRRNSKAVWWWFGEPVGWTEDRGVYFKNADLLHSRCRRWLIAQREQLTTNILEREERQRRSRPVVRDGSKVELHAVETDFAMALKIAHDGGRQMVMLGLGESAANPDHLFALSVPETHRLVTALQHALDSVAARGDSPPRRQLQPRA